MSIRSDAYSLCKKVWDSPIRESVRDVIISLNSATNEQIESGTDRSSFGFAARQLNAQILGYLVVDRDKANLQKNYPPLRWTGSLQTDEREILAATHRQIVRLDNFCREPLTNELPTLANVVDPYSHYKYQIPDDAIEEELVPEIDIKAMSLSFHNHPGIQTVLETAREAHKHISEDQLEKAVLGLERTLLQGGPLSTPQKLASVALIPEKDSPERIVFRCLSALLCIRASMGVLNELVFQALLTKKLPVLDNSNVIDYGPIKGHLSGVGISLICQPDESLGHPEIGLALIKDPTLEYPFDLCKIESLNVEVSQDFGDVAELHLRLIDENLNPYSGLIERV